MLHLPSKTHADGSTSQICSSCSSTSIVSKQPVQASQEPINNTPRITKARQKGFKHVRRVSMIVERKNY